MKPLPNAAHLARLAEVAEFEAQLAALDARCVALDFRLRQAQAASRQRRAQEIEMLRQTRAMRQSGLAEGLSMAIFGGAGVLFSAAQSSRPRLGLPELPGRR
jgi:hypothetical protein